MSEQNVELVLKDLEHWNRGDMDAFVALWDDDVVLRAADGWRMRAHMTGPRFPQSPHRRSAPCAFRERQAPELEGDMRFSQVTTFREGKVVLAEFFWDHHDALKAAGLSE
jgi:ketosteroid isomerase-like protein